MIVEYFLSTENNCLTVNLVGRITYSASKAFIEISKTINQSLQSIIVDLANVNFIDSVGVGMLIIMAEHAKMNGCSMKIIGVSGQANRVFKATELLGVIEWDGNLVDIEII